MLFGCLLFFYWSVCCFLLICFAVFCCFNYCMLGPFSTIGPVARYSARLGREFQPVLKYGLARPDTTSRQARMGRAKMGQPGSFHSYTNYLILKHLPISYIPNIPYSDKSNHHLDVFLPLFFKPPRVLLYMIACILRKSNL